jgi:hypothetical protein
MHDDLLAPEPFDQRRDIRRQPRSSPLGIKVAQGGQQ